MENHFTPMEESRSQLARERLMADLAAMAADAEALLQATADDAGDKAKETRARITASLEKAKATCQEYKAEQIDAAKAALGKADETIRAHPYQSIGIAFGVGLLVGALLRRK